MSERKQDRFRSAQEELAALGLYFPGMGAGSEPARMDAIKDESALESPEPPQLSNESIPESTSDLESVVSLVDIKDPVLLEQTEVFTEPQKHDMHIETVGMVLNDAHLDQDDVHLDQDDVHLDQDDVHLDQDDVHTAVDDAHLEQDDAHAAVDNANATQEVVHAASGTAESASHAFLAQEAEDLNPFEEIQPKAYAAEEMTLQDRAMSMVEHLGDLRKRLIYSVVAFVVFLIGSLVFVENIFHFLTKPLGTKLTVLGPAEIIHIYFMIGGFVAIVPTIPFVMWQLWLFIAPGLKPNERKVTLIYIPAVLVAFVLGILFGYEFVFPKLMIVLGRLSTQNTDFMPTADAYFSFMTKLILPFGFIFEMPLIVMFLTRLGIINPYRLNKIRKYAYFFIVLISFMLTPPEITTHLSLTIPMILLYEFSIQISKYAYKRRLLAQEEAAKGE